jgi:methionyl-tRNA synthetase
MRLDDYEAIPCSVAEYIDSQECAALADANGIVRYFKLVPKEQFTEGRNFSEKALVEKANADQAEFVRNLQKKHEELYQKAVQAKPDRFAEVDALIENHYEKGCWDKEVAIGRLQGLARAIVSLIEREKV